MSISFKPFPIVGALKTFFVVIIFTVLFFVLSIYLSGLFLYSILIIWVFGLLKIISLFLVAMYHIVTLEEKGITYKVGVFSRRSTTLPYHKISEASYHQGVMERLFRVGTLKLDTAGGSFMAIYIPDLRYKDLKTIIQQVKDKSGKVDVG
jgi:uncharacterized membrane protein YdbT with pleckstrin-like domain